MIRPFKPADKSELLKIFRLNTPKYFDESEIDDFEKYLAQKANTYLTVEVDNHAVGGIGHEVIPDDNSGRITWMFLHPDYIGKGIGKQAVAHCLQILSTDKRVEKFVVRTSQLAYKFVEKFGFEIKRTEKDYWGKGLDLYEMEKPNN